MIERVVAAHTFLTRLPMPRIAEWDDGLLARSAPLFPLVGVTVAALAALGRWAANPLGPLVASLAAVVIAILVTGALHEDGLADVADALGARERGRRLDVLRDPCIGTFGVLAVGLSLLARVLLLGSLDLGDAVLALFAAHALARWSVLPLAAVLPPARPDGSGRMLAGLRWSSVAAGTALALLIAVPALAAISPWALTALVVCPALTGLCAVGGRRAFGGVTGDVLGATAQVAEIACYVCVVAALA